MTNKVVYITLKVSKFNYNICYYFMGSSLILVFVYKCFKLPLFYNIFTLAVQRFFLIKKVGKIKNIKNAFL